MKSRWKWLRAALADDLYFDAAPEDVTVRYRLVAPSAAADASAIIFGAGRIEVRRRSEAGDHQCFAGQLAPDELRKLLSALLGSGLATFDALRLARERTRFRGLREARIGMHPLPCKDLGRSEIQLNLTSTNTERVAPYVVEAILCAVQDEAAAFPQWATITRYADADRRLRSLLSHPSLTPTRC